MVLVIIIFMIYIMNFQELKNKSLLMIGFYHLKFILKDQEKNMNILDQIIHYQILQKEEEIEEALYNNSYYTKNYLTKLHENIHVVRHPKFFIHFWSHHEKMVIIDSKIVFMGGIDLCFGRYEEEGYPLKEPIEGKTFWRGQDYSNPRIRDFEQVQKWKNCLVDKNTQPRMPWRDIAVQLRGSIVLGMKKHFLEFWNFNNVQFSQKSSIQRSLETDNLDSMTKSWRIKNQQNFQKQKKINRSLLNDKQLMTKMEKMVSTVQKNQKIENQFEGILDDEEEGDIDSDEFDDNDDDNYSFDSQSEIFQKKKLTKHSLRVQESDFIIQGLRSASNWSIGLPLDNEETSIQLAYINLIKKSQKFIYIENQFFISSTAGSGVENTIVDTLAKRIIKAIIEKENFLAVISLPLLPGFGGNITKKDGQLLRIQIEYHLNTIYKSSTSLIKQIMQYEKNWEKYLKIFGLRNHTIMNNTPVSEIVYIHSKLMIVDDNYVILGSANINDRSMLGKRDSELAVVINQQNKVLGMMDGIETEISDNIRQFRINCFKSMFKLEINYDDPLDEQFWRKIENQTKINEEFYWKVFQFYPHNSLKTLEDIIKVQQQQKVDSQYYNENKDKVIGFALPWPVYFLENEKSFEQNFNFETMLLPKEIFT